MHHRLVALLSYPLHQLSDPTIGQLELPRRLPLRDMPLAHFVQYLQPIAIILCQQQRLLLHPAIFPVVKRNFLLCSNRNFSLCCDIRRIDAVSSASRFSTVQCGLMPVNGPYLVALTLAAIALLLFLILAVKLHAFLALLVSSMALGLAAGMGPQ